MQNFFITHTMFFLLCAKISGILILCQLVLPVSLHACPAHLLAALTPEEGYGKQLEEQRTETLAVLKQKYPDIAGIEVRVRANAPSEYGYPKTADVFVLKTGNRRELLPNTYIAFGVHDRTLSANAHVDHTVHDAGINKLLLLAALNDSATSIQISSHLYNKDLATFLSVLTYGEIDRKTLRGFVYRYGSDSNPANPQSEAAQVHAHFINQTESLRTPESIQSYRARLLGAYTDYTPSGRLMNTTGFRNITFMQISFHPGGHISVYVQIKKGGPGFDPPPRIVIIDRRNHSREMTRELSADGTIQLIDP
ncbi:MAG: hypothetical protein HY537_08555 [Deltaproteobacteria bacterium]|nr:hypothetical protein [Deltaproteobacteria bacterium]